MAEPPLQNSAPSLMASAGVTYSEDVDSAPPSTAYQRLWTGALARYFMDVANPDDDNGEALADFCGNRSILRHLAERAGVEPEALEGVTLADVQGAKIKRTR